MSVFRRRTPPENGAGAGAAPGAQGAADEPVAGYTGLKTEEVIRQLKHHSQVELTAIEEHERANGNRQVVLDKLRYLRGDEPLTGYDELEPDGIVAEMRDTDLKTRMRVREYERKFKRRDAVLSAIAGAGREAGDGRREATDSG